MCPDFAEVVTCPHLKHIPCANSSAAFPRELGNRNLEKMAAERFCVHHTQTCMHMRSHIHTYMLIKHPQSYTGMMRFEMLLSHNWETPAMYAYLPSLPYTHLPLSEPTPTPPSPAYLCRILLCGGLKKHHLPDARANKGMSRRQAQSQAWLGAVAAAVVAVTLAASISTSICTCSGSNGAVVTVQVVLAVVLAVAVALLFRLQLLRPKQPVVYLQVSIVYCMKSGAENVCFAHVHVRGVEVSTNMLKDVRGQGDIIRN